MQSSILVCLLQMCKDKLKTKKKVNVQTVYYRHLMILSLTKHCRSDQIIMNNAVLAYSRTTNRLSNKSKAPVVCQQVRSRSQILQVFHKCIEKKVKTIQRHSFTIWSLRTECGVKLRCHFFTSSYTADMLKLMNCLPVKQVVLTSPSCQRYVTPRYSMDSYCLYRLRNVEDMLPDLLTLHGQKMKMQA